MHKRIFFHRIHCRLAKTQHTHTYRHTYTLSSNRFELFIRFANTTEIIKLLIAQSENESKQNKKKERNDRCVFALATKQKDGIDEFMHIMHRNTLFKDGIQALSYSVHCVDYCTALRITKRKKW